MNLREEKHWTYGASAFLYGARGQRPYISYTSVQTDKTKETIQEILAELKGITGEKPVTEEELSRVKRQTILELPGSRETMTAVGSSILNLVEFDLPDNYYDTYVSKVEALTTEDLDQAARSIISPNQQVWIIVGDRAAIEDDIRSLALGPIHHIDADGKPTV